MVKKHFLFEAKIIFFILVALLIVVTVGLLAYNSMSGIVLNIREEIKPDRKLILLKQMQSDLSEAESSVKSYSITKDNEYLEPFYQAASSIDAKVNSVYQLSKDNKEQQEVLDSLKFLIEQKFILLKAILSLQQDNRVEEALGKISDQLIKAEKEEIFADRSSLEKEKSLTPEPQVRKSNIISRLFSRKQKKEVPSVEKEPEEVVKPPSTSITIMKKQVAHMQEQEIAYAYRMMEKQLELTQKDKTVMDRIRTCVAQLENIEKQSIEAKIVKAEKRAKEANRMIAAFCIMVSILLFSLGYMMIRYTKKINAYNKALKKAKKEAENLAKMKESFLSTMSHEIRTPMNAIYGFTEQLLETPLAIEQKEQVRIIKKSADHLIYIINDILDFSKLGAGKLELYATGFNPHEVLEDVVQMMQPYANDKKIYFNHTIDKAIPEVLIGDAVRLRQVLINVIGNAIKFTSRGEVKVNCQPVLKNEKTVRLQITVTDTGIGIPASKVSTIFNEFEQAETDVTGRYGGTGLGLTITKRLITMQSGTIQVSSKESVGTVVTISIPYTIGTTNDMPISESDSFKGSSILGDVAILVADDEEYNRMLLATILKKWGVIYTEVVNGQEAILELEKNKYDLVLMDIQMPVMNGIKASQHIRTHDLKRNNREIPILAVIASVSGEMVAQCKNAGINDVLHKPFKEKELYDKVSLLLNKKASDQKEEVMEEEENINSKENSLGYSLEEIVKMSNNNNDFVKDMIRLFIKATSEGIVAIKRGIKNNSWEFVAYQAHKISAPCKHIEAEKLYSLLKQIEDRVRNEQNTLGLEGLVKEIEEETNRIIQHLDDELSKIR